MSSPEQKRVVENPKTPEVGIVTRIREKIFGSEEQNKLKRVEKLFKDAELVQIRRANGEFFEGHIDYISHGTVKVSWPHESKPGKTQYKEASIDEFLAWQDRETLMDEHFEDKAA